MVIRSISILLLILSVLAFACPTPAAAEKRPPNFILIFVDNQGYQDLGRYGAEKINTPRVDRMAAEGIRFTDFDVSVQCADVGKALVPTERPAL